jgi:hypothetical protein
MSGTVRQRTLYVRFHESRVELQEQTPPLGQMESECGEVRKKGWSKEASYWLQYAYNISDCDKDFIAMLLAENGSLDHTKQSYVVKDGVREDSYGFCQIHRQWHADIVDDPRFQNQDWQLQKCLELYRNGTVFYAPLSVGYSQIEFL